MLRGERASVAEAGASGYRCLNYADPFGLCPKSLGGDGKSEDRSDCPTNNPEVIKKVDALEKENTREWLNTIRFAVAAEVVAASAAVSAVSTAATEAAEKQAVKLLTSRAGSFVLGFGQGFAAGMTPGGRHLPIVKGNMAMRVGINTGKGAAQIVKHYDKIRQMVGL